MGGLKNLRISQATGFTVSALRFHEEEGVLVSELTWTG